MVEESGEAMGKLKRLLRGEGFDREGYLLELGDCLAYLAVAADSRGLKLTEIHDAWITPEGSDLVRQAHQLIKKTERALDQVLLVPNPSLFHMRQAIQSELSHVLMQLSWNASHATVCSNLNQVMQLNLDKFADRKARNGHLRGSGYNR